MEKLLSKNKMYKSERILIMVVIINVLIEKVKLYIINNIICITICKHFEIAMLSRIWTQKFLKTI